VATSLRAAGVPAAPVAMSEDRIDHDADNSAWGMFPVAHHDEIGDVRVDGIPAHLSATDWRIDHGAPLLGQHNREVFCGLLGLTDEEFAALEDGGVL
jgi:crotonobetainyl-CoA:carnitine CoA-transferase CaiB-like acyl-CoA transferase